ncbi:hypothetical protein H261_00210 [Paramagnetospirillum caucaseum]|uniref:DUF3501 family protein n=1 Tax=Paramagnetospirillum caucaseum TaxID=1244869 RepID=M2ZBZ7_9PROT|nr:DUF3501 family protein [Paramagnetospirillum caucaseum]EME71955.1 hypothetical protein H261_00210 [Paramagnetospirillum caucaseum]
MTVITPADILPLDAYERVRPQTRAAIIALKRNRRLAVGPHVTVFFECRDTMLYQIHEMLRAEKGGAAQLEGELEAYNSLIPNGGELIATLMIEIDDEGLRHRVLSGLGGIEESIALEVDGEAVAARPETDVERTTADGKTSSVHFLHFPFTPAQIERFRRPGARVVFTVSHPGYGHMAVLPPATMAALAGDFS